MKNFSYQFYHFNYIGVGKNIDVDRPKIVQGQFSKHLSGMSRSDPTSKSRDMLRRSKILPDPLRNFVWLQKIFY